MSMEMDDKWEEAERTGERIYIGSTVLCDSCNDDYTHSNAGGGFVFGSSAYCPKCAERMITNIERYNEAHYIGMRCPEGMSFADMVREYRGDGNYIQITKIR